MWRKLFWLVDVGVPVVTICLSVVCFAFIVHGEKPWKVTRRAGPDQLVMRNGVVSVMYGAQR